MSTPGRRGEEDVRKSKTGTESTATGAKSTNKTKTTPPVERIERDAGTASEAQHPDTRGSSQTKAQPSSTSLAPPVTRSRAFSGTINDWSRERRDLSSNPEGRQQLDYRTLSPSRLDMDVSILMAEVANLPPSPNTRRTQYTGIPSGGGLQPVLAQGGSMPIPVRLPTGPETSDPPAWLTRGGPGWTAPYASSAVSEHGLTRCAWCNSIWDYRSGSLVHERKCPAMGVPERGRRGAGR
ncbi:hypothetical protein CALVIDRAFT_541347 [Calocera viscosa TUFC12733]|uniref:Uncharacterized protein n=1 Tax=Calocera viscosa (strain TUFC12733) TaxID=1330018 RepID=A0A167HUI7_CALVF|nr:hypothetical protein CALVIDRAFT_541347 [Calocera viscosa TUFC12733]